MAETRGVTLNGVEGYPVAYRPFTLARSFLEYYADAGGLVAHHIDSFNDFIHRRIQKTVNEIGKITVELPTGEVLVIKLGRAHIEKPQIREADGSVREVLPMEARLRNLTYAAPLFVEMTPVFEEREHDTEVVEIGEVPVMVKSDLCPLSKMSREELIAAGEDSDDPGGYFIINGTERVLILSEEIAPNKLILQRRNGQIVARINSERAGYVQRHIFERRADGVVNARFANLIKAPVPVVVLMKALGMAKDADIIDAVAKTPYEKGAVFINIYENQITSQEEALDFIGRRMKIMQKEQRIERAQQILDTYLLANLGTTPEARMKKARFLALVMRKIILLQAGKILEDDIDHYANKRLKMAGDLLELLFRSIIMGRWGLIARLQYNYQKMMKRGRKLLRLQSVIVSDVLTKQIMRAMATGNWVGGKTGVSQRLERHNFIRTLEHLRSVVSPLSPTQEHFEARELHPTQWGRLDAVRTPEGQSIGLRNFLSMGVQVTIPPAEKEEQALMAFLKGAGVKAD